METTANPLTNLQRELLKVFASNLPEKDLLEIRKMLSNYLLQLASREIGEEYDKLGYTQEDFQQILNDPNQ